MALRRFDPSKFTTTKAKPLPVLLLLDVSGSMTEVVEGPYKRTGRTVLEDGQTWEIVEGGSTRIDVLNQAVKEMIDSFAKEERAGYEFLVSVITFGVAVRVHLPPTKASSVAWQSLTASGETPLGEAIATTKGMIEDKETTPARAYRPMVVLVSDGKPTDRWEEQLGAFVGSGRSMKCDRIAVAIGAGTDEEMLGRFIAGTPNSLFHATDAGQILDVFRRVTMSVTARSKSRDPNQIQDIAVLSAAPPPPVQPPAPAPNADDEYW